MSTGAELAVIGAPIVGLAVIATAATAGVVVVGGIAIIGTGRLCVAAGSYVVDRVRERAALCAYEYTQYQKVRAAAFDAASKPLTPVKMPKQGVPSQVAPVATPNSLFARDDLGRYHEDAAVAESIIAALEQQLNTSQQAADQRIQAVQRRAYISAMLEIEGQRLPTGLQTSLKQELSSKQADLDKALASLRAGLSQLATTERMEYEQALRQLEAEADAMSVVAVDDVLRDELLTLRRRIDAVARSTDTQLLIEQYAEFRRTLDRLYERDQQRRAELHQQDLAQLWGELQAVGALLLDLQSLAQANVISIDPNMQANHKALADRYEALAPGATTDIAAFREEASAIRKTLANLQRQAVHILNVYQQQRLVEEIEQSMNAITFDDFTFETVSKTNEPDGTIVLRGYRDEQNLKVVVQPDARVKYEAYGFGDERCLKVAYALIDQLVDRGLLLRYAEPELTRQATVVTQVIAALIDLGTYREDEITIHEDAAAVVIQAGADTQTQRLAVNSEGAVTPLDGTKTGQNLAEKASEPEAVIAARKKVDKLRSTLRRQQRT